MPDSGDTQTVGSGPRFQRSLPLPETSPENYLTARELSSFCLLARNLSPALDSREWRGERDKFNAGKSIAIVCNTPRAPISSHTGSVSAALAASNSSPHEENRRTAGESDGRQGWVSGGKAVRLDSSGHLPRGHRYSSVLYIAGKQLAISYDVNVRR